MKAPRNSGSDPKFLNMMSKEYRESVERETLMNDAAEELCLRLEKALADTGFHRPRHISVYKRHYIVHAGGIIHVDHLIPVSAFASVAAWGEAVAPRVEMYLRHSISRPDFEEVRKMDDDLVTWIDFQQQELESATQEAALLSRQCAAFCRHSPDCEGCSQPGCPDERKFMPASEWREICLRDTDVEMLNRYAD